MAKTYPPCEHNRGDNHCAIASGMAGKPAIIKDPRACEKCLRDDSPKQPNHVTASLAIAAGETQEERKRLTKQFISYIPVIERHGPGDELSRILHALGFRPKEGCRCSEHQKTMNEKGIDWCANNRETIEAWLKEEADRRNFGWLFSKMAADGMITLALHRARQHEAKAAPAK